MTENAFDRFADEVLRFKEWAPHHQGSYGEWECDYEHWNELWAATETLMETCAHETPDLAIGGELLYTIARDNEIERLRCELLKYPELLRYLARIGIDCPDRDAKWQIVVSVADARLSDAADLIRPYLADSDEYVRRRSLLAIASFSPREAEEMAKGWMDDEFEYSRIAGLHVLDIVNADSISFYLEKHADDPSRHVRTNVEQIRKKRQKA